MNSIIRETQAEAWPNAPGSPIAATGKVQSLTYGLKSLGYQGFSFDYKEHTLGLRCVAACIFDEHREAFAAISISGPISRITDNRVTELYVLVIHAAKEISLTYGGMR